MGRTQNRGEEIGDGTIKAADLGLSDASTKGTPVDNDSVIIVDSVDGLVKRSLFSVLTTFFSTVFAAKVTPGTSGNVLTSNGSVWVSSAPTSGTIALGEYSLQLDPTISADGKWSGITETGTAGATLAFGDCCYYDVSTSKWKLAKANVATTSGGVKIGFCVLAGSDTQATEMLMYGKINAAAKFPTLTIGAVCYISAATAGAIVAGASNATTGQPSATDNVIRIIGYGNTNDELFVSIDQTYITHV